MPRSPTSLQALLTLALIAFVPTGRGLASEIHSLSELAPPQAVEALEQIPDPGRRLLALRSYLRTGSDLAARWSWTEEEIEAFQGSDDQRALLAEVAAIADHFARANPGFEIYANTRVRSLDVQISNWNSNESVGAAAAEILSAAKEEFGSDDKSFADVDPDDLRAWLVGFTGKTWANIAAPGLTAHGQGHAIDFQVMKDGHIIAGADSGEIEQVWRAEKWDEKLKASIDAAGPSFHGPLASPDEPWHYDYDPALPETEMTTVANGPILPRPRPPHQE
ncbi:hypothetical protein HDIA_4295 [Hartmannibacter diazotrophicus]|uniref:D-alanyl-D-alanine carboxypeptidase n=1 Tax=Hartmannibacter diazotrophicus TaxID=1482074 RepID=A0A2C9DC50_9HYPH|nr:hypothetical protein [Hartmannibacter diazotrophicus]SON57836.1 hypothetical protein HDIA_4295 [Hartmannibacter diazotrophicus]